MLLVLFSLLALYVLPLLLITISYLTTSGFVAPGTGELFGLSIALTKMYLGPTRETLGTFVVPFITAYAVSKIQKGTGFERDTKIIFFSMVVIFLLSAAVYCVIHTDVDMLLANMGTADQVALKDAKLKLLQMPESYVKEVLAYISLLLGISHSKKAEDQ